MLRAAKNHKRIGWKFTKIWPNMIWKWCYSTTHFLNLSSVILITFLRNLWWIALGVLHRLPRFFFRFVCAERGYIPASLNIKETWHSCDRKIYVWNDVERGQNAQLARFHGTVGTWAAYTMLNNCGGTRPASVSKDSSWASSWLEDKIVEIWLASALKQSFANHHFVTDVLQNRPVLSITHRVHGGFEFSKQINAREHYEPVYYLLQTLFTINTLPICILPWAPGSKKKGIYYWTSFRAGLAYTCPPTKLCPAHNLYFVTLHHTLMHH